ncbi:hypothetical protein [Cupriavidus campinensis]
MLAAFKRAIEALVFQAEQNEGLDAPVGFAGEVNAPTLEHNVRKTFLNQLLTALGWTLEQNVEEEARVKGDTTLFLDYLGVHLETRVPLLIFEAKAWDKPFVSEATAAGGRQRPETLIARALNHIKSEEEGPAPVIGEWMAWLSKLRDYVRDLKNQSEHLVSRVAISSGQWLVIFTDPNAAFLESADVDSATILAFPSEAFVRESDQIFGHISYGQLVAHVPSPLRTTQLRGFISANAVRRVFRALWTRWASSGSAGVLDTFPQILVYPAVVLERADGVFLHVSESRFGRQFVPAEATALRDHLDAVRRGSNELLEAVFAELQMRFDVSDLADFRGFPALQLRGSNFGLVPQPAHQRVQFIRPWPDRADEFLLVTGAASHFLLEEPTVDPCVGHNWGTCQQAGQQAGGRPIVSASVDPRSFFTSGERHHCAHRVIHDRRRGSCYVAAFETYLCCRACIFQQTCWPTERGALPCGSAA